MRGVTKIGFWIRRLKPIAVALRPTKQIRLASNYVVINKSKIWLGMYDQVDKINWISLYLFVFHINKESSNDSFY